MMFERNTLNREPDSIQSEIEMKEKAGKNYKGKTLAGFLGEQEVCYQLEISHRNLYYLWDVTLQNKIGKAQIDFLVFTPKMCFVIEVKNWTGEIVIDKNSDVIQNGELITIDNPIKTNENKLRLIESFAKQDLKYLGSRKRKLNDFSKYFKSIIVFSRTRNKKRCVLKNESGLEYIMREDKLISYIEKVYDAEKCYTLSQEELIKWRSAVDEMNLNSRYEMPEGSEQKTYYKLKLVDKDDFQAIKYEFRETEIFKLVQAWRLEQSRRDGITAKNVFWDREVFTIIVGNVTSIEGIRAISDISREKVEKYGKGIIQIIKENQAEVQKVRDKYKDLIY